MTSADREIPPKVAGVGRTKDAGPPPSGSGEGAILALRSPPRSVPPSTGKSGDTTPLGQALVFRATRANKTPPGGTGEIVEEAIQTGPTGEVVIPLPTWWVTLPEDDVEQRRKRVTSVLPRRVEAEKKWRDVMEEEERKHTPLLQLAAGPGLSGQGLQPFPAAAQGRCPQQDVVELITGSGPSTEILSS